MRINTNNIFKKTAAICLGLLISLQFSFAQNNANEVPVRGFAVSAPPPKGIPDFIKFVKNDLSKTAVNTLFLRVNYNFKFKSHPELADRQALSTKEVKKIVDVCKKHNIDLIPIVNL